jgi:hypothetical protein
MICLRRNLLLLTAVSSCLMAATSFAQNRTNALSIVAPGPIPTLESPVDFFRELLAMEPAERKQSLSNRPPEIQKKILTKVREYGSLKPDERELRLRATELQWYLQPLMSMPRTNRESRLALIPEEERKLVEERLARWDLLPSPIQEEFLDNELASRYFTQLEFASDEEKTNILNRMSPERRAKLEAGLKRWRGLSAEQREQTLESFKEFFELTPKEKQKVLGSLSATEQRQMEKTLQTYAKLPVQQRLQCIRSFEKFTGMSLEDRQTFLKNAERWKLMSPSERESWRTLVKFAPLQPLPPSATLKLPAATMPTNIHRPKSSVATNSN